MVTILASALLIAYGYSNIAFKSLWWWDKALLYQYFGIAVQRTPAWDRQQDLWGYTWIGIGVGILFYGVLALLA